MFRPPLRRLSIAVTCGLLLLSFPGGTVSARAETWDLVKFENRDYVSVQNIADFYKLQNAADDGRSVLLKSPGCTIQGAAGSKELIINGVKFILSYELQPMDGKILLSRIDLTKLVEPVLRPSKMRNARPIRTIVLDAGHGGHDRGATSAFGNEKDFALDTVMRTRELLLKRGYKVVLTRNNDTFIPLNERARFANQFRDGMFVCVHFNAGSPTGTGIETFTLAPRFVPSTDQDGPHVSDMTLCAGNIDDPENMALATAMHASLLNRLPMTDRGIKRARFWVLRECTIPAVLIEGGFVSNAQEAARIAQPVYRQTIAECIVQAIGNYQRAIGQQPNGLLVGNGGAKSPAMNVANPGMNNLGVGGLSGFSATGVPGLGPSSALTQSLTGNGIGSSVPMDGAAAKVGAAMSNDGPTVVVPRKN